MCVICVLQIHVAYGVFSIQELANTQQVCMENRLYVMTITQQVWK